MQSVVSQAADPGFTSLILDWSHILVEIHHEIISMVILLLSLIQELQVKVCNIFLIYLNDYYE